MDTLKDLVDALIVITQSALVLRFIICCIKDVGRILRTFKIKVNVEVTDNGKDDF